MWAGDLTQRPAVRSVHSPPVDNEEATAQLFERNAAQFAAREKALKELMNGVRGTQGHSHSHQAWA